MQSNSDDALSIQCDKDLSYHTKQRVARAPEYCQFNGVKQYISLLHDRVSCTEYSCTIRWQNAGEFQTADAVR